MEQGIEKGRKPPEWFLDCPESLPTDEFYLSAFWDLSTCRGMGMSIGPIPWHHIRDYADFAGLDPENGFAFASVIRRLDAAYLTHMSEAQTTEAERQKRASEARARLSGRARSMKGRPH